MHTCTHTYIYIFLLCRTLYCGCFSFLIQWTPSLKTSLKIQLKWSRNRDSRLFVFHLQWNPSLKTSLKMQLQWSENRHSRLWLFLIFNTVEPHFKEQPKNTVIMVSEWGLQTGCFSFFNTMEPIFKDQPKNAVKVVSE